MIPRDLVTLSQYGPYRTSGSGTFRYARTHNHQNTCVKEPRSLSFTSLATLCISILNLSPTY